jgi:predicted phage terminase large subunit-like protein
MIAALDSTKQEYVQRPYEPTSYESIAERMLGEESLSDFIRMSWPTVEPGIRYMHNWHIDCICEHLEAVDSGQIKRLIVNIPPRYMKSTIITIDWPVWTWIHSPHMRWLFASYSDTLARDHSVKRRSLMLSDWYQERWGDQFSLSSAPTMQKGILAQQRVTQSDIWNDKGGTMYAVGMGGSATGRGGNRLVIDDPHDPQQAWSDAHRETGVRKFRETFYTRLNDKKRDPIVVVMQRLHEADLTGALLQDDTTWEHLKIQGVADHPTSIRFPVSLRDIERDEGDILWPEREGEVEIADMRATLGTYGFAGQYQQEPAPPGGVIFQRDWWQFYRELPQIDYYMMSVDCAFKDTSRGSRVAVQIWGIAGPNRYLVDRDTDSMDFTVTVTAVRSMHAKWQSKHRHISGILIEDKANGPAVVATLRRELSGIIEVEPQGSKEARAHACLPTVEAGNVYLPEPDMAPWVHDFIHEASMFPAGAHDDDVDAMTQLLNHTGGYGATTREFFTGGETATSMDDVVSMALGEI